MAYQQFFYDQQIRRYIIQFVRILSNLQVEFGKDRNGVTALQRVPVIYGDSSRQVAYVIQQGSENYMQSTPCMAVYISGLEYDRARVQNPTYVDKLNLRERYYDTATGEYATVQGDTFTVERLMPVPYKLTLKVEVWTSNTEQKLQILEQLCTLFNPALEIQSTDNYIDWTSISYILLTGVNWSSKPVPTGTETPQIETATLTFELPIFISAPALVKKLGVIQKIIANLYDANGNINTAIYDDANLMGRQYFTVLNYGIILVENEVRLVKYNEHAVEEFGQQIVANVISDITTGNTTVNLDINASSIRPGMEVMGLAVTGFGNLTANTSSTLVNGAGTNFLQTLEPGVVLFVNNNQLGVVDAVINNTQVALTENSLSNVSANAYSYIKYLNYGNTIVLSTAGNTVTTSNLVYANVGDKIVFTAVDYKYGTNEPWRDIVNIYGNLVNGSSQISVELDSGLEVVGTVAYNPNDDTVLLWNPDVDTIPTNTIAPINAIIDPLSSRPNRDLQYLANGTRYLLVNDYNSTETGANASVYNWLGIDDTPLVAYANDIIQYNGSHWVVAFQSNTAIPIQYVTNMTTNTQYKWDGAQWTKSYEGFYPAGKWQLII
jgi:T4-like virus Myoviridae tail sheath stabiliser